MINDKYYVRFNGKAKDFNIYINKIMSVDNIEWDFDNKCWEVSKENFEHLKSLFKNIDVLKSKKVTKHKIHDYENIGNGLKLSPYDYQKEVIKFCIENRGVLVKAPCGAGKTPIILGSYVEAKERGIINGKGLIIVKASLKTQWLNEVSKFTNLKAVIIKTKSSISSYLKTKQRNLKKEKKELSVFKDRKRSKELIKEIKNIDSQIEEKFVNQFKGFDLYILNYETLKDENVRNILHQINVDFIGADEIQSIKNRNSERSKATYEFADAKIKIGATATPIKKDPTDLFGIFSLLNKDVFGEWKTFEHNYIQYKGYGNATFKNIDHLYKIVSPYIIVKTEEEISDQMPETISVPMFCNLTAAQSEMNVKINTDLEQLINKQYLIKSKCRSKVEVEKNESLQKINVQILALQTFAQELADDPNLLKMSGSELAKKYVPSNLKSPKIDMIIDIVKEIIESGHKVVLFSRFERMQTILTNRIKKAKIKSSISYINGSLNDKQRYDEVYNKFNKQGNYNILLASDAGAEGLNLSTCKYLIEVDLADSYAIQTQRQGRIHRADSIYKNTFVYQIIARDSYDEIAQKIIQKKKDYDKKIVSTV